MAVHPTRELVATGGLDSLVCVANRGATPRALGALLGHTEAVESVAWAASGASSSSLLVRPCAQFARRDASVGRKVLRLLARQLVARRHGASGDSPLASFDRDVTSLVARSGTPRV